MRFDTADQLAPANQAEILRRLEERRGPVVLTFEVTAAVAAVPLDVPTFWLGVTGRSELQIRAMAIVTRAVLVRVAARGFSLANIARGAAVEVRTFEEVPAALSWCREHLA